MIILDKDKIISILTDIGGRATFQTNPSALYPLTHGNGMESTAPY